MGKDGEKEMMDLCAGSPFLIKSAASPQIGALFPFSDSSPLPPPPVREPRAEQVKMKVQRSFFFFLSFFFCGTSPFFLFSLSGSVNTEIARNASFSSLADYPFFSQDAAGEGKCQLLFPPNLTLSLAAQKGRR